MKKCKECSLRQEQIDSLKNTIINLRDEATSRSYLLRTQEAELTKKDNELKSLLESAIEIKRLYMFLSQRGVGY